MGYREKRKLIKVGESSKAVVLPKPWLDYHGDAAEVLTLLGDSILIVAPLGFEERAEKILKQFENGKD